MRQAFSLLAILALVSFSDVQGQVTNYTVNHHYDYSNCINPAPFCGIPTLSYCWNEGRDEDCEDITLISTEHAAIREPFIPTSLKVTLGTQTLPMMDIGSGIYTVDFLICCDGFEFTVSIEVNTIHKEINVTATCNGSC